MDRKSLTREYKETARPAGVFRVHNIAAAKSYVGSTVDLPGMLNRQRFQLESGGHPSRELQRAWAEQGPDDFEIEVLDTLELPEEPGYDPAEDLSALLDLWRDKITASGEALYTR